MLFLARWLGPEEFGFVGMIAVFISLGHTLVISGMTTSLIRTTMLIIQIITQFLFKLDNELNRLFFYILLASYIAFFYGNLF